MMREKFIPYRRSDIIAMCLDDGVLTDDNRQQFKSFCQIITSLFHFELHKKLEYLKDCYAPFNPDADTIVLNSEQSTKDELKLNLECELKQVLEQANYEAVSEADLNEALQHESLFRVKLQVDFNDFEKVLFSDVEQNKKLK